MGSFHRNSQYPIRNSIVVQIEARSLLYHSLEDLKKDRRSLIVRMIQSEKVDPRPKAGQKGQLMILFLDQPFFWIQFLTFTPDLKMEF